MVVALLKPSIPPQYLKGQIIASQGNLYESLQRSDGSYFWHFLSTIAPIDEDGIAIVPMINNKIEHYLKSILMSIRANPQYKITSIDYDSFYLHRARFPLLWNEFLKLYRTREVNAKIALTLR